MKENKLPSNRSFGLLFTAVFALFAGWAAYKGTGHGWYWLVVSACFGVVTAVAPNWLTPLNKAWMTLGALLNRLISPIVLGAMYFIVIVPAGLVMRAFGKDPMMRKFDPDARSYWIERDESGIAAESFKDQF